jgi:hypothetical protein
MASDRRSRATRGPRRQPRAPLGLVPGYGPGAFADADAVTAVRAQGSGWQQRRRHVHRRWSTLSCTPRIRSVWRRAGKRGSATRSPRVAAPSGERGLAHSSEHRAPVGSSLLGVFPWKAASFWWRPRRTRSRRRGSTGRFLEPRASGRRCRRSTEEVARGRVVGRDERLGLDGHGVEKQEGPPLRRGPTLRAGMKVRGLRHLSPMDDPPAGRRRQGCARTLTAKRCLRIAADEHSAESRGAGRAPLREKRESRNRTEDRPAYCHCWTIAC